MSGSMTPVPQGGEVLGLLEKKKKLMKKDGLYKFVLWREALRWGGNSLTLSLGRSVCNT